jgi:hypothetical protein
MNHRSTRTRIAAVLLPALAATVLAAGSAMAQPTPEAAVGVDNEPIEMLGGEPTLRAEEATVTRYEDRLVFDVRMDTPAPGSYRYPDEVPALRQASPEIFTGWAFVFNEPENCVGAKDGESCGPDDFSEDVRAAVYGIAGHLTAIDHEGGPFILDRDAGGQIVLRGEIKVGQAPHPGLPPGETTFPLDDPLGAEIHFAIAPHGQLDPSTVTSELYQPAGNPGCGCWWVSVFSPDGDDG